MAATGRNLMSPHGGQANGKAALVGGLFPLIKIKSNSRDQADDFGHGWGLFVPPLPQHDQTRFVRDFALGLQVALTMRPSPSLSASASLVLLSCRSLYSYKKPPRFAVPVGTRNARAHAHTLPPLSLQGRAICRLGPFFYHTKMAFFLHLRGQTEVANAGVQSVRPTG